ncbi:MAG: SAM-dependent methyltransferase, partial [Anaerotignum sp.]|nr:SAM-dependent methyltransferase [Anaerotignum sp.]
IEYDERIYQSAVENRKTAVSGTKTEFLLARAEEYDVPAEVNRYYFFNPFSVEILREVMTKIKESHEKDPREAFLFFYYPSPEYLSFLAEEDGLELQEEVPCGDLFEGNDPREKVMVFSLSLK